ncbi:hypothetical protein VNI00_017710 [Paramarasmius palmivorus]|uniref:Uncharacterized protein n=1 Tax=Paramarasmius palmivorus TaxID=297713 RepID=A0AAW0B4T0_9AGAR
MAGTKKANRKENNPEPPIDTVVMVEPQVMPQICSCPEPTSNDSTLEIQSVNTTLAPVVDNSSDGQESSEENNTENQEVIAQYTNNPQEVAFFNQPICSINSISFCIPKGWISKISISMDNDLTISLSVVAPPTRTQATSHKNMGKAIDKLNQAKAQGHKNTLCRDSISHCQQDFDTAVQRPLVNFTTSPPTRKTGTGSQCSKHTNDVHEFFYFQRQIL